MSAERQPQQPVTLEWIALEATRIPSYQREPGNCDKLVANWDDRKTGALLVSLREGVLWLVDGQRRTKGARRNGLTALPAVVLRGETEQSEAELYLALNGDRLAMRPVQRHQAEIVAEVPRALAIRDVLGQHNLVVANASQAEGRFLYQAIVAAEHVYDDGGAELLDRALGVIVGAFPDELHRLTGNLVHGVGYFLARDSFGADDQRVIRKLGATSVTDLNTKAANARAMLGGRGHGGGSPVYMAKAVAVTVYPGERGMGWAPVKRRAK